MITNIPCVILSGGKSSRMGKDKSLLPFGECDTLIQYQYDKLSTTFSKVYISTKTDKFNFKADLILDKDSEISSPMIALKSILEYIKEDKIFIITVDTPFIEQETIKFLIKTSIDYDITIAKDEDKIHNLCGVFSKCLLGKIDIYLNDNIHKINYLIRQSNNKVISFNNSKQFLNINNIDDYNKAHIIYKYK